MYVIVIVCLYHQFPDYHHQVPVLGHLPAGFSSNSAILTSEDIATVLLNEHSTHSESEDFSMSSYALGCEKHIAREIDAILAYVLFSDDLVYDNYTAPLLRSVYFPNMVMGYYQSHVVREKVLERVVQLIRTREHCVSALQSIIEILQHSIDITESMRLPMRITCKLFSRLSILFSIPIPADDVLNEFLTTNPQMVALEAWCERINAGCKLWSPGAISWRRRISRTATVSHENCKWWEYFGWTTAHSTSGDPTTSQSSTNFSPNKTHNIWFGMVSVSALFVYVGLLLNRAK